MNLTLKATNYEVSEEVRARVEGKFKGIERLLGRYADTALVAVEIGKVTEHHRTGEIYRAEINVDADGKLYRATADQETLEAAVDKAESEVRRELKKAHGRTRRMARATGVRLKSWMQGWGS